MIGLPLVWGATPDERQRPYDADTALDLHVALRLHRLAADLT